MDHFYHSPLFDHIREYFESARGTIFIFVPYVKRTVLEQLLDGLDNRIVIVTTWEPRDIQFRSSDLEVYPYCRKRGIALYVTEDMHLKIYSHGLESAILATGNISKGGLMGGNYEAGVRLEELSSADRLFLEEIRGRARLVDDAMYDALKEWHDTNHVTLPEAVRLSVIVPEPVKDHFLTSALPMTRTVDLLVEGYVRISAGKLPSADCETTSSIFHDLANYDIASGRTEEEFREVLAERFFAHPFILRMDGLISQGAYFGRIKEWIQNICTDVPVPSRRELTGNVQVLMDWFVSLGGGRYVVDIPGARSQRIRRLFDSGQNRV